MPKNPLELLRRRARRQAEMKEEVSFLQERYGEKAREGALAELSRPNLPSGRRAVLQAALKRLHSR